MNRRRKMSSSGQAEGNSNMKLRIKEAKYYTEKKQKLYKPPTLLGCFSTGKNPDKNSTDKTVEYIKEDEKKKYLKYLKLPSIKHRGYHLNCEDYVSCDHIEFSLNGFLKWIKEYPSCLYLEESTGSKKQKKVIDFVLTRKDIMTVCRSVYNKSPKDKSQFTTKQQKPNPAQRSGSLSWMIYAKKFQGTIYMLKVSTQEEIEAVNERTPEEEEAIKRGNIFVKYITSATESGDPDPNSTVNEFEHFFVVAKNKFDDHSLLFTAEVDAADPKEGNLSDDSPKKYVEIKLVHKDKIVNNEFEEKFVRFKLIKWWLQSHLIGIKRIIYGTHDSGIVHDICKMKTEEIEQKAKNYWSSKACINFLYEFLSFVKKYVTDDKPDVVYEFHCKGKEIKCTKKISQEIEILPEEFISYFQQGGEKAGTSGTSSLQGREKAGTSGTSSQQGRKKTGTSGTSSQQGREKQGRVEHRPRAQIKFRRNV